MDLVSSKNQWVLNKKSQPVRTEINLSSNGYPVTDMINFVRTYAFNIIYNIINPVSLL